MSLLVSTLWVVGLAREQSGLEACKMQSISSSTNGITRGFPASHAKRLGNRSKRMM